jgi:uridine monophosphate synthetase
LLQRRRGSDALPLYAWVAKEAAQHSQSDQLGLVVGATQTDVFSMIRSYAPKTWLLCPGVGTQGGSLEETIKAGWGEEGNLLLSVSRAIAGAPDPAQKACQLKEDIQRAEPKHSLSKKQQQLAHLLIESRCVLFGTFTLKSGIQSPLYIDLRKITSHPPTFAATVEAYVEYTKRLAPTALAALPFAGLPIASGLALQTALPLCYPRPPKAHGTQKRIEGGVREGSTVLMIDDLATRGSSALEALPIIRSQYKTSQLLVLIDRESGAKERLQKHDVTLHSVFRLRVLLDFWKQESLISNEEYNTVSVFLSSEQP